MKKFFTFAMTMLFTTAAMAQDANKAEKRIL